MAEDYLHCAIFGLFCIRMRDENVICRCHEFLGIAELMQAKLCEHQSAFWKGSIYYPCCTCQFLKNPRLNHQTFFSELYYRYTMTCYASRYKTQST